MHAADAWHAHGISANWHQGAMDWRWQSLQPRARLPAPAGLPDYGSAPPAPTRLADAFSSCSASGSASSSVALEESVLGCFQEELHDLLQAIDPSAKAQAPSYKQTHPQSCSNSVLSTCHESGALTARGAGLLLGHENEVLHEATERRPLPRVTATGTEAKREACMMLLAGRDRESPHRTALLSAVDQVESGRLDAFLYPDQLGITSQPWGPPGKDFWTPPATLDLRLPACAPLHALIPQPICWPRLSQGFLAASATIGSALGFPAAAATAAAAGIPDGHLGHDDAGPRWNSFFPAPHAAPGPCPDAAASAKMHGTSSFTIMGPAGTGASEGSVRSAPPPLPITPQLTAVAAPAPAPAVLGGALAASAEGSPFSSSSCTTFSRPAPARPAAAIKADPGAYIKPEAIRRRDTGPDLPLGPDENLCDQRSCDTSEPPPPPQHAAPRLPPRVPSRRPQALPTKELRTLFLLPIEKARLEIGLSKNAFRRLLVKKGYRRWPQRQLIGLDNLFKRTTEDQTLSESAKQARLARIRKNYDAIMDGEECSMHPELKKNCHVYHNRQHQEKKHMNTGLGDASGGAGEAMISAPDTPGQASSEDESHEDVDDA